MKKVLFVPIVLISSLLMIVSCAKENDKTASIQSSSSQSMESSTSRELTYSIPPGDNSIAKFLPWIYTLDEADIESVTYESITHKAQTDFSFWDYTATYVSSSKEDLTNTISFLRTSQIETSREGLYREEPSKASVTFTVTLKNGKDLVIYGTDSHYFEYIYFDKDLIHIHDYSSFGLLPFLYFSIPLPVMSNKLGYTFTSHSFDNSFVHDKEKTQRVADAKAYKLKEAVFIDDTFEVSSEYNDFNHFMICCDHDGSYIVFESSKQFRIFAGIGVYSEIGRYRIANDISFADLSIQ